MQRESFIVGGKEYQASKIPAFEANGIILRLQRLVLPVLGGMAGGKSLADLDAKEAMEIISTKLDDAVMTDIVMPMFKLSRVACTSESPAYELNSSTNFNKAFVDADGLADMYELIFLVLRYNFGAFFTKLAERFGAPASGSPSLTA